MIRRGEFVPTDSEIEARRAWYCDQRAARWSAEFSFTAESVCTIIAKIPPILEAGEEVLEHGMFDRGIAVIRSQVLLRDISRMLCPVNEYVIPGLILRRTRSCETFPN